MVFLNVARVKSCRIVWVVQRVLLEDIAKIDGVVNRNDDLETIIATLRSVTKNLLGFRCES